MNAPSRKNHTRPVMIMLIISWLIILGGVIWFIMTVKNSDTNTQQADTGSNQEQQVKEKWYIGENILLSGKLEKKEGLGLYTHTFTSDQGKVFGAKSSELDLFAHEGSVEIKGEVADIDDDMPIVLITELVGTNKPSTDNEENEISLQGTPSLYYDLDTGLMMDLSISDGYEVVKTDSGVAVVDRNAESKEVLNIDPFVCKPGDALEDCAALKERFVSFNNDSFTNALGVTLYNLTETNTWFAFNEDKMGYSVRAADENQIATFGSLLGFLSEDQLDAFVVENKAVCKSLSSSLEKVAKIAYQDMENGIYTGIIQGTSSLEKPVTCKVALKVGSPLSLEMLQYDDGSTAKNPVKNETDDTNNDDTSGDQDADKQQADEPVEDDDITTEGDTAAEDDTVVEDDAVAVIDPIVPPSAVVNKPTSFEGWLQYASVRGFVMWFSKQGVSYFGTVLESAENLGQANISCRYKVNVIAWKNADNVATNPDIVVYECTGVDPKNLPATVQYVGSAGNKQFVTKWFTNNLSGMEVFVEDAPKQVIPENDASDDTNA